MPLFSLAAREWLATKGALAPKSIERFNHHVVTLGRELGSRLVCDIGADDIAALQRKRFAEGKAGWTVNYEIGVLRQILKACRAWGRPLRPREVASRAP
jgi:hypothetical protein